MSRRGRELTLFSIYASSNNAQRKPTTTVASVLKPTRPKGKPLHCLGKTPVNERVESHATQNHSDRERSGDENRLQTLRSSQALDITNDHGLSESVQSQANQSPRFTSPSRPKSPIGRVDTVKRVERWPPHVVLSLYGDGFIELTPKSTPGSTVTGPFTLRIRLFKAADESIERSKVESDASRHVSPELNDEGEFVRWSCCGSTDKSVFGCPVASDEHFEKLTVEELMKLRPPKLIACKLTASKMDPSDSLRFVIFDRGYPGHLTPNEYGPLNAGCRIWWRGYECWATDYDIPHGCWVDLVVDFDGQYLQIKIDGELVDTATRRMLQHPCRTYCVLGCQCPGTQWSNPSQSTGSIFIGGYSKYSQCVSEWRVHAGFVGLIAEAELTAYRHTFTGSKMEKDDKASLLAHVLATEVGELTNLATPTKHSVTFHRSIFWRSVFPSLLHTTTKNTVRLLGNFYHGAHHDISTRSQTSFENLLLSVIHVGEVRIRILFSREFAPIYGSDHGCRTQAEYDLKCNEFIRQLELLSPLLVVAVNQDSSRPPLGSFEVNLEIHRSPEKGVSISLHSMTLTSCFPSLKDVKAKISEIVSHEARRSPGESAPRQAIRHFLSLAEQARDSRERTFMEAVINRKAVITEKRIVTVFQRIGFHFSHSELQDLIRMFKSMQDDYHRHQYRMDDIPTMSLLSPSPTGLYRLPLLHHISLNAITPADRSATRSKWQFIAVLLNYDLQLLDFVQSGCPESDYGNAFYAQSRYLHGGFVDRFNIHVSNVPSHVYCILFSLRKRSSEHQPNTSNRSLGQLQRLVENHDVAVQGEEKACTLVQLENGETLQQLAQFEVVPTHDCKWLSLAALYRSRKSKVWRFQALGGSHQAGSIHAGLEQMNTILVEQHIVQVYEIILSCESSEENPEFADFACRFSKNIRFGRNGKIHVVPRNKVDSARRNAVTQDACAINTPSSRHPKLSVALRIQGLSDEITVYRHDANSTSLPTVQSVCRSILRTLADHGIKESLQQNPFVSGTKKVKRSVTVRVTTEDSNTPVPGAYIFIERSLDNQKAISNLASKIVPTITMGSRLVSIRRRLQKKKYSEEIKIASRSFVDTVISLGMRYAMVSLRDSKFVPVVKSRAVLRRAMRRRYERIREKIFSAMSESERSRLYSRNGPTRLQQLFQPKLNFTPSEKDLLNEVVEMELDAFRRELGIAKGGEADVSSHEQIEAVWQSHIQEDHSASLQNEPQSSNMDSEGKDGQNRPETEGSSEQPQKKPKRSYTTDAEGIVTCLLAPGSYSLYVFHPEYFEWTSLAVVFPTVNASGMYGGSLFTSAPQEIVVPLETFKWSYTIQLVDFYQQHSHKHIEGVPVLITDKVTSEETILTSRVDGSVPWDVRKGIYSVRVPTEGTSFVYSGSKNVVVDGGRYHPPRTIFIPILLGKVRLELAVGRASRDQVGNGGGTAHVQLVGESTKRAVGVSSAQPDVENGHLVTIGSTNQLQLRPGRYTLTVTSDTFFSYASTLNAPWNADGCRELVMLCPVITEPCTYRVIFSNVNEVGVLDAMIVVFEPQVPVQVYWKHETHEQWEDVSFDETACVGTSEYQTFTVVCRPGRTYNMRVAISAQVRSRLRHLRPRAQVYDWSGLVVDILLQPGLNWNGEFYWTPCTWNSAGQLISVTETS